MNPASCNFYINSSFNASSDITWSFQYALTGSLSSSGGFSTFLFDSDTLSGQGGMLSALGLGKLGPLSAVQDHIISIAFDSTGLFGLSGSVFNSGLTARSPDSLIIRTGSDFQYLTSFSLTALDVPLILSAESWETLRFNFTNVAQTLNIAKKDKKNNRYVDLVSIDTGLTCNIDNAYKIGFSYATPVSAGMDKTVLKLKNIHFQGYDSLPDRNINEVESIATNYILQSPLSGRINISSEEDSYLNNSNE